MGGGLGGAKQWTEVDRSSGRKAESVPDEAELWTLAPGQGNEALGPW